MNQATAPIKLRVEQDGRVRRLTLAAPGNKNILDTGLAGDLVKELADADADEGTGAVLIDAEGPIFCGGIEAGAELPDEFFGFGEAARKPIIVAMEGVAVSAGVAILANAHIVMAAQGSSFGLTDIRSGLCPPGVLRSVAAALGVRRTRELALTGRVFTTPDALNWGLVHHATPAFELEDRAMSVAAALAKANRVAVERALRFR